MAPDEEKALLQALENCLKVLEISSGDFAKDLQEIKVFTLEVEDLIKKNSDNLLNNYTEMNTAA